MPFRRAPVRTLDFGIFSGFGLWSSNFPPASVPAKPAKKGIPACLQQMCVAIFYLSQMQFRDHWK